MASVDGSRSLQGTSDEFHTNLCGPCKTSDDVESGASHYCNDCLDWLCDHCKDYHRKLPVLKNHVILSGSQVPAATSTRGRPGIVIYCSCNKNQEIEHFCDDHRDIVCDDCKHTNHYKCKVSCLQDKSSSYNPSRIDVIMLKIEALEDDFDQLQQTRNDQSKSLELSKGDCTKEINLCRKELNDCFDDLEKSMLKLLDEDEGQKRIRQHIATLTATLKMIETDRKLLQDSKSNGESALMFAADVKVSRCLNDYEERLSDIAKCAIDTDIKFEKNKKLVKLLAEIDSLGSLIRSCAVDIQKGHEKLLDSKIQSQKQINVKLPDEDNAPWITGSVAMPTGELVLCDYGNDKLKLLDNSDALKESFKLNASPRGIACIDAKTVIITLPSTKQLQYIDVLPQLFPGRVMQMDKKCWGIHVTGHKIFTTCHNEPGEGEVRILDMNGNLLQQLGINEEDWSLFLFKKRSFMFTIPSSITVSQSKKKVFVSDLNDDIVTCMTMDNQIIYQHKDDVMKWPRGLYCDDGDNILVCCENSNNIQMITAEGKKHRDLVSSRDGLEKPYSISYRQSDNTLIVGCKESDVFLFKLEK